MKTKLITLVTPALLIANLAVAGDRAPVNSQWLNVEGETNLDYFAKDSQNYETNLRLQDSKVKLTANVARGLKAVIAAKLSRMLIDNGTSVGSDVFDAEKFINEAYIEVRMSEITGTPVAVVLGKHAMAFGQQASELPMYQDNLLYNLGKKEDVIGVTVKLEKAALAGILDSLEVSAFEAGEEDLKIANYGGLAIRMSKNLTQQLKATGSAMVIGQDNNYVWSDAEKRAALGFVYSGAKGNWKAYAEGIYFEGNAANPNKNWGATAGVAVKAGPGDVVVEYSYLEATAHQIAAAYNLPVGRNLVISPEVRHNFNDDGSQDTRFGVRSKVKFNSNDSRRN